MGARLRSLQRDLIDSLWFTPTVIALLYAALALVLLQADQALGLETQGRDAGAVGGADGARGVLFAIAGTTLSVLGVVFSLTIVGLQIASAQFTPRVMRNLTGDRGTQVVLGVFLGTFTYSLLVLRAVRSPGEDGGDAGFVPVAAVAVAIGLALVSIAFMIYTINHVARSVQVAVIIKRVTHDTLDLLDEPLAAEIKEHLDLNQDGWPPDEPGEIVAAEGDGYLEAIDAGALLAAAETRGLTVRTEALVGSFLLTGAPLATVWPGGVVDAEMTEMLRSAFVFGPERTRQQDLELGIRQLADIAVRALSPAINDPPTATLCIDRLGQLLVRAASRDETEVVVGPNGGRILLRGPSFAQLTDVAFTQIRHYGSGDSVVAMRLMITLGEVAARVPLSQQEALREQAAALLVEVQQTLMVTADISRVAAAAAWSHEIAVVR
ncbi:MAG TPA: DUF2254 domain-containing protein [Herpetosiphonaceae bacterium]|nr:DUF2254 domain-containing protein [Herpetosiphonaceae bacterium]